MDTLDDLLIKYDMVVDNSINLWFTSNHDENSWNGSEYEKYGDMATSLAVFSFIWNGMPLIYSGQEIPNTKRLEFFDKDAIQWTEQFALADFYKTLNSIKKNNPALRAAEEAVTTYRLQTGNNNLIAFLRKNGSNEVLAFFNWSNTEIKFEFSAKIILGDYKNIFTEKIESISGSKKFDLPGWGFIVYEKIVD